MNRVVLSGGLGNQLFQVAAGFYFFGDERITLVESLGKPHGRKKYLGEMKLLNLPATVTLETNRRTFWAKLISKINNLQIGLFLVNSPRSRLASYLFMPISNFLISIYFKDRSKVKYCREISNIEKNREAKQNVISGYFQNFDYVSIPEIRIKIVELFKIEKSEELLELTKEALKIKPLVIQVRLGDYLHEDDFGIPGTDYYRRAIDFILGKKEHCSIWIFSNDLLTAKKILPEEYKERYKFVENLIESPLETLEAMRHGASYILSNSTFGWWGAFLSHEESPIVITPNPWFRSGNSPKHLIPNSWTQMEVGEYFA
jgi:hypothetical protein